jgi:hypothetical protein
MTKILYWGVTDSALGKTGATGVWCIPVTMINSKVLPICN